MNSIACNKHKSCMKAGGSRVGFAVAYFDVEIEKSAIC